MSAPVGSALRTVAGEQEETPTGDGKEADAGRAGPLVGGGGVPMRGRGVDVRR
jgi:hypothetical protein